MPDIDIIDLHFQSVPHGIAAFLVRDGRVNCLVETGPYSCIESLKAGLHRHGLQPDDISHVFLSHIHFDHAGAAWYFAERGARIWVHPAGYKHLISPERLIQSASRIYGDQMEVLWGEMRPIAAEKLLQTEHGQSVQTGDIHWISWHTPGHAAHHIAWQCGDALFTGDAGGISIDGGPVQPPVPPPDIDIEAWLQSIAIMQGTRCTDLYLTHFGKYDASPSHWRTLSETLKRWAHATDEWIQQGHDLAAITPLFSAMIQREFDLNQISADIRKVYEYANPAYMGAMGLFRYWQKQRDTGH